MPVERGVAVLLVLLLGTLPSVANALPSHPEGLVAPLVSVLLASLALLARRSELHWAAAGLGSTTLVVLAHLGPTPGGLGVVLLIPVALAAVDAPRNLVAAGLGVGLVAAGLLVRPFPDHAMGMSTSADLVGALSALALVGWVSGLAVHGALMQARLVEATEAADTLESELVQDQEELLRVLETLAPSKLPGVHGHGLRADRLNLATPLGDGRVLLAEIEGEALATLSVGWILRATCGASEGRPEALVKLVHRQLDELNPPNGLRWIAVIDGEQRLAAAPTGAVADLVDADGFTFGEPAQPDQGRQVLADLYELEVELPAMTPWDLPRLASPPVLALGFTALAFVLPSPVAFVVMPLLLGCRELAKLVLERASRDLDAANLALDDRIDCRDDVHFSLGRLHGGLLPYRVESGPWRATAHRLRGDCLDGSFADILRDRDDGHLVVVAGEVAGEGIAARFLGLTAQFATRWCASHEANWSALEARVRDQLRFDAATLRFPLRATLGRARVSDVGEVCGDGILDHFVTPASPEGPTDRAQLVAGPVYVVPTQSRPGPDDDAPRIEVAVARRRVLDVLVRGDWEPGNDALPTLFSAVFDGEAAPAHGTLVELSEVPAAAEDLQSAPIVVVRGVA